MVCNNCGTTVRDDVHFCPKCGIKLTSNYYSNQTMTNNRTRNNNNGLMITLIVVLLILVIFIGALVGYIFINKDGTENGNVNNVQPSATPTPTSTPVQYAPPVFTHIEASSTRGVDMTAGVANYYYPSYAIDGDVTTTWSPNRNYGLTPTLTLYADSKQHVNGIRMANGYFKSPQTYSRNRRITLARIEYEGGYKTQSFGIDQYRIMQDVKFDEPIDTSYIRIQVLETHYGDWKDICISEVEVY